MFSKSSPQKSFFRFFLLILLWTQLIVSCTKKPGSGEETPGPNPLIPVCP